MKRRHTTGTAAAMMGVGEVYKAVVQAGITAIQARPSQEVGTVVQVDVSSGMSTPDVSAYRNGPAFLGDLGAWVFPDWLEA